MIDRMNPEGGILGKGFRAGKVLLLAWAIVWAAGQGANAEQVSGHLENGFRVLTMEQMAADPNLLVYRGDYIRFDTGAKRAVFSVPALDIEEEVGADPSLYFKMKEAGVYDYVLGEIRGTLEVVEYTGALYQALTADQARQVIEGLSPVILDVRTPREYNQGRIGEALLIPVQELQKNLAKISAHKEDPVLIYCATGNRSTVAAKILIDSGFKRVFNLRYGIEDWRKRGHPVIR